MRSERFRTPGAVAIRIRLPRGAVEIETIAGDATEVELAPLENGERAHTLIEEAIVEARPSGEGHEVVVEVERPRLGLLLARGSASVRIVIRAPHGAGVDLESGAADVRGEGRFGPVHTKTGAGDVFFADVHGEMTVKVGSGDVHIGRVEGRLSVATGAGDVYVQAVGGRAEIRCASGDVRIREAGPELSVETASGDQRVDAVREGSVDLKTVSGDLEVGVRRGSRVWIDARSFTGDTRSELELSELPVEEDGPLVEVRATAVSGDVRIARAS